YRTLKLDAVEVAADTAQRFPAQTRAAIVVAKASSVPKNDKFKLDELYRKLKVIDRNYEETGYEIRDGQKFVENPREVKAAIRANSDYKQIIAGLVKECVATEQNMEYNLDLIRNRLLVPEIREDFDAAVERELKIKP